MASVLTLICRTRRLTLRSLDVQTRLKWKSPQQSHALKIEMLRSTYNITTYISYFVFLKLPLLRANYFLTFQLMFLVPFFLTLSSSQFPLCQFLLCWFLSFLTMVNFGRNQVVLFEDFCNDLLTNCLTHVSGWRHLLISKNGMNYLAYTPQNIRSFTFPF